MHVWELLDRPIVLHRPLVSLGLGITGALLLSQALYWTRRTTDRHGWFYKTIEEWEEETGLTRSEQSTARKRLVNAGFMEEKLRGVPARMFYRVETDVLSQSLLALPSSLRGLRKLEAEQGDGQHAGTQQTGGAEDANQSAGNLQAKVKASTTTTTTAATTAVVPATRRAAGAKSGKDVATPSPIVIRTPAGREIALPGDMRYPRDDTRPSFKTWSNYAVAFHRRYGAWPVFNARQAALCTSLAKLVGEEHAPKLVVFYLASEGDAYVNKHAHKLGLLVQDAETWFARLQGARVATSDAEARTQAGQAAVMDSVQAAIAMRSGGGQAYAGGASA